MFRRIARLWSLVVTLRHVHYRVLETAYLLHPVEPQRWWFLRLRTTIFCGLVTCPECHRLLPEALARGDLD